MDKKYSTRQAACSQQAVSRNSDLNLHQTFTEVHTSMPVLRNSVTRNAVRDSTMSNRDNADNSDNVHRVSEFISQQVPREIISLKSCLLVKLNESISQILILS